MRSQLNKIAKIALSLTKTEGWEKKTVDQKNSALEAACPSELKKTASGFFLS